MIEKEQFKKTFIIEPTAASIGINREDWFCYKRGVSQKKVLDTMIKKQYDIVPKLNPDGNLTKYYTADLKSKKLIDNQINEGDCLYYMTHVRDLIVLMNKEKRSHYFLKNVRDEIVGLTSLSNINCREFNVYLFSLISYVEKEFANLIQSDMNDGVAILSKLAQSNYEENQLKSILKRYERDRLFNIENDYKEYLYIHHLIDLVKNEGGYKSIGYTSSVEFEEGTNFLRDIRNHIAHPVKALVRNISDLPRLEESLFKLYELKQRLDSHLGN